MLMVIFWVAGVTETRGNRELDSLQQVLTTAVADTDKVGILINIGNIHLNTNDSLAKVSYNAALDLARKNKFIDGVANAYRRFGILHYFRSSYDSAIYYWEKELENWQSVNNSNGIARAYNNIGLIHKIQGNYDKALDNFTQCLEIFRTLKEKNRIADTYNNIGIVYYNQGNYPKALENYFNCLKIYENLQNMAGIARVYNNIGIIYLEQDNKIEALDNYYRSLKIRKEIDDQEGIATSYLNIGSIFHDTQNYPKAIENYVNCLTICITLKDKDCQARSYFNIGQVYHDQKIYDQAQVNYEKSLKIRREIGDSEGIAESSIQYGLLYQDLKDNKRAIANLTGGLKIAEDIGNPALIRAASEKLSNAYEKAGNFQKAYQMHVLFKQMADSLSGNENVKKLTQMQMEYEFDKKQKQVEFEQKQKDITQAERLKRQQLYTVFGISGFILMLVFSFVLFRGYRNKQKANEIISTQKEEVESQKALVEQKNKDIVDSIEYAKRIQEAILISEQQLNSMWPEYFVLFKPRDIVSGDFYWAHQTPDNRVIWAVADCTGHGVPGAFMSMIGIALLNEIVIKNNITKVDLILNELKTQIIRSLGQTGKVGEAQDGMDIAICALNRATNTLEFAGAYNPMYLVRNGELSIIKGDRQPIGIFLSSKEKPFKSHQFDLLPGDGVYIFSDGYVDQFGGPDNKKLNFKRFQQFLLQICDEPMPSQKERLDEFMAEWRGGFRQIDDMCLIGVRI